MNIKDIIYFVTLSETRHFRKAAEKCFVTQPTLSGQLRKLEMELGLSLIDRNSRDVRLTEEGEILLNKAKVIMAEVNNFKIQAEKLNKSILSTINFGTLPIISPYVFPKLLGAVDGLKPRLNIHLHEVKLEDMSYKLETGELDFIIIPFFDDIKRFECINLYQEVVKVGFPIEKALVKSTAFSLKDVLSNCITIDGIDALLPLSDVEVTRKYKNCSIQLGSANLDTVKSIVSLGFGHSIFPSFSCIDSEAIRYIDIKESIKDPRDVILAYKSDKGIPHIYNEIVSKVQNAFKI